MASFSERARAIAPIIARQSVIMAATIVALALIGGLIDLIFDGHFRADWRFTFALAATLSIGWFFLSFFFVLVRSGRDEAIERTLNPAMGGGGESLPFFVAIEYYGLIANRSFVVFVASDGLYGWKFEGMVDTSNPLYFQPYSDKAREWSPTPDGLRKLSEQPGSFYIPHSEIKSVDFIATKKWGMGPIPHCGKLYLRLENGKSREFVLLGNVDGNEVKKSVLQGTSAVTHSKGSAYPMADGSQ